MPRLLMLTDAEWSALHTAVSAMVDRPSAMAALFDKSEATKAYRAAGKLQLAARVPRGAVVTVLTAAQARALVLGQPGAALKRARVQLSRALVRRGAPLMVVQ